MTKQAVFTMKLEAELRESFMQAVADEHRPASQVVRELMREYIERHQNREGYKVYLQQKVERSRASMLNSEGYSNEEVEALFAKRKLQNKDAK